MLLRDRSDIKTAFPVRLVFSLEESAIGEKIDTILSLYNKKQRMNYSI